MDYRLISQFLKCALVLNILIPHNLWSQNKCPKAEGLSVSGITETSAVLSWTGDENVETYNVDVKHGSQTSAFKYSTSISETTTTVEGLQPGSNYRFRVMTKCEKGSGGSSQWVDFMTAGDKDSEDNGEEEEEKSKGPCPKATNLAILEIDDTSATLAWLGNEENISYLVDVHQKEHTPTYKVSKTVDTTILFIKDLVPGGNYKFRVKSKCEKNSGGSSSWINFTTTGGDTTFQQCPKATNLSVPEVTDSSALLKWIARDTVTSFTVEVKSFGQTTSFFFDTTMVEDSLWVEGLEADGDYHFRVLVECADGSTSGSSDWSKFRTLAEGEGTEEESGEEEDSTEDPSATTPDSSALVSKEIATFPNPAQETFTVELPTQELGYLTYIILSDMSGRVVFNKQFNAVPTDAMLPIPVHNLQEGLYKLVIRSIDFHKTKTILVQHR